MDRGTLIRTIVLVLALINQFLIAAGKNPIPGSQELWGEILSLLFTAFASIWAWFKNNYITERGRQQKEVLQANHLIK
ncbi:MULTISPECIES: phage holin [Virgibacillus]|uniref:Holin, SPP1 family n=2 Tax=Virgibacillus TaxID=84406 RepID=A0A024Q9Y6_9BACI|nr:MULTISPECIES: phage holin [Virgibacillus]EQB37224.1 holin [Virgibacillus sp. CM-4]MYL40176.1 phage holin [Virgibacillus massiliensis]GGJ61000.1 holin [Virgibacillus kapii]CDQ39077.1 holin, SPP1 family [Virgibacillus massiliensis]